MKKTPNAKRLKAIKALADRGVGGEKENAQRIYKELSKKNKKAPDTEEIKDAKMYINKKIDVMCKGKWDENTLKAMIKEKFEVSVAKVDDIKIARNMYEHLIWLDYLAKGKKYKKKIKDFIN